MIVGHELGHNFGVHHASTPSCTDAAGLPTAAAGTCTASEYGDPCSIMGSSTRLVRVPRGNGSYLNLEYRQPAGASSFSESSLTARVNKGRNGSLRWTASTDNLGVVDYVVTRPGRTMTVSGTSVSDKAGSGTFAYTVVARDAGRATSPHRHR